MTAWRSMTSFSLGTPCPTRRIAIVGTQRQESHTKRIARDLADPVALPILMQGDIDPIRRECERSIRLAGSWPRQKRARRIHKVVRRQSIWDSELLHLRV